MTTAIDSALLAFVRARLHEVEKTARSAITLDEDGRQVRTGEWRAGEHPADEGRVEDSSGEVIVYAEGSPVHQEAVHIALNDPVRVVRQVVAMNRILDTTWTEMTRWKSDIPGQSWKYHVLDYCEDERCPCNTDRTIGAFWTTARDVASIWSDHADYDPTWALA